MDIFTASERLMTMSPDVWARHANPLSVYSRIVGGTVLFFALWSAFWIGWASVPLILLSLGWVWLNPRAFKPPSHSNSWGTRAVLGERVFLNRANTPIPSEHLTFAYLTTLLSGVFFVLAAIGAWQESFWLAFAGWHGAAVAKVWFCDRMVWLWSEMKNTQDSYIKWDRADWSSAEGGAELSR